MNQQNKLCVKCQTLKPISNFYGLPNGKYGVDSKCKLCVSKYKKIKYQQLIKNQSNNPPLLSQKEKDEAFIRAKKIIEEKGIDDVHLLGVMNGKFIGSLYKQKLDKSIPQDPIDVWEMIENNMKIKW